MNGKLSASSRSAAGKKLKKRDLYVTQLHAAGSTEKTETSTPHASASEVAWQMWQLSVMVEAGVGLAEALSSLARQSSRPGVRSLFEAIAREVRDGSSLSDAMARYPDSFPNTLVVLIRASEISGTVETMLKQASDYLTHDIETIRRVRGAALYPIVMLALCLSVAAFLVTFVMPQFAGIFASQDAQLPVLTRALLSVSNRITQHWQAMLIAGAVCCGALWMFARSNLGQQTKDRLVLSIPIISPMMNAFYQSRAFRTISVLIGAHVPLNEAVGVIRDLVPNAEYRAL